MSGLYVPIGQDFKWQIANTTARPVAGYGTTVTAGGTANTKGAWAQLFSAATVVNDVYGILICVNNGAANNAIRNRLLDIGVDNAGGTNYRVIVPDLITSNASPYTSPGGGVWYYFPIYIRSGSSIAARAQSSTGNAACSVYVNLFGQPRRPDAVRVGSIVYSFGISPTVSRGTPITIGTTAKSAYTLIGNNNTGRRLWWWQLGYCSNDSSTSNAAIHFDAAAGPSATVNKPLLQNFYISTTTAEQQMNLPLTAGCTSTVAAGDNLYIRSQSSTAGDTTPTAALYAVGD
jgi:hypothetical protein